MTDHDIPFHTFPTHCQVRGCRASPQEWYEQGPTVFEVCHEHGLHLRAGEARSAKGNELLLGPDSAPELLAVRHTRSATGPLLTLRLGQQGVCTQEITIQDSPGLRTALRVLLDHGEGPGADPSD